MNNLHELIDIKMHAKGTSIEEKTLIAMLQIHLSEEEMTPHSTVEQIKASLSRFRFKYNDKDSDTENTKNLKRQKREIISTFYLEVS